MFWEFDRRATCLRAVAPLETVAELDALLLVENLDLVIASSEEMTLPVNSVLQ